jgi:epoxyqueuosine reductase
MSRTRTATTVEGGEATPRPDPAALKAALRAEGRRLGLHRVGFARPDLAAPAARLDAWLAKGYAGEMAYIGRRAAERAEPGRLLDGFATAIVASQAYAEGDRDDLAADLADPARAVFARYARGADYHEVLKGRLEALAACLRRLAPGAACKVYVDTGPVLEKDLAVQAGVGWRGKHTNLVDPGPAGRTPLPSEGRRAVPVPGVLGGGNWLFLGVILTDLALPPDGALPDRCGSCAACLDACPTDAFPAPYVLDARRCISYLTIELKGAIPRDLRPLIGNRVFGCDDCLAVCPWNRFAAEAREAAYAARPVTRAPLTELLELSEADFARHFKDTPVWRTRRRGLLRNVAVALGNARDPAAVPALARALADPEPLVRGHAAWALDRIGGPKADAARARARRREADPYVRDELGAAR